ncbi:RhoGAP domain containing protein [Entamoeba histolytica HM-1:IMSS-B]|uniref:RhoGAP domain containing protein n=6 Tax=Entamoeba histolytica TaxID=5759 RepID=C4M1Y8_ENTH1|nr:RhoGAP domain containing protein [Entamoeba histolytica HM-1:IMSS]EMD49109.1 RhoGAP domain containing protein [Entamoeba histolytica KU27]EMH77278.1 RhoGAP domain containing protein [Entamoeba histolytica HM-1:IMSS-B]EMS16785.1 RhoGAP domain containing protein [Entamoeba histolytica HM-3:IMSS]ENY62547.1 RhoGAP domain containing protein [Entamoeba histolytica HM-1:IMSS-A]GAT95261.1 rhogap domain containing protein [Entamoeba histolytica]|eukprot:XP_652217.1 RhoGAP domain containing protein [Entamoeba histolytica HM-1:IMSS]
MSEKSIFRFSKKDFYDGTKKKTQTPELNVQELTIESLQNSFNDDTTDFISEKKNNLQTQGKTFNNTNKINGLSVEISCKTKERVTRSSVYGKKMEKQEKKTEENEIKVRRSFRLSSRESLGFETVPEGLYEVPSTVVSPKIKSNSPQILFEKEGYKSRRMSWRSKNSSEERRDISLIAMDEDSPRVLSDKELKNILKNEEKKQKLLASMDLKQKSELLLDIQCLSYHVVTIVKEPLHLTLSEVIQKYLKTNTKEIIDIEDLVFRSQTGKILSKNLTIRGALTLNGSCIFVCFNNHPFSLPKIYPTDISVNNPKNVIPQVVFNLCWWIYTYGYLVEGIFRVSGDTEFTKKKAEKCVMCDTSFLFQMRRRASDVHNVVGTLKTYIREYTDGLIDYNLVKQLSSSISQEIDFAVEVLKKIPREHLLSLSILYGLVNRLVKYSSIHMMTLKNFAMILGPLIIHIPYEINPLDSTCYQIDFSNILLNNYQKIIQKIGLTNPFEELPDRDDIQKFDKNEINESLQIIRSMSITTYFELERLRKMMEIPEVVQYIQTLNPSLIVDVIAVITEHLLY